MQVAIACIKVASQAVSTMPSLFFFPIIPFIMTVCLIVYWVAVAGYLYSAGTITAKMTTASSSTALTISVSHRDSDSPGHCLCGALVLFLVPQALGSTWFARVASLPASHTVSVLQRYMDTERPEVSAVSTTNKAQIRLHQNCAALIELHVTCM